MLGLFTSYEVIGVLLDSYFYKYLLVTFALPSSMKLLIVCFLYRHNRVELLTPNSLAVYKVGRHDKGMYQCLATNTDSSAQAMAELRLGGK